MEKEKNIGEVNQYMKVNIQMVKKMELEKNILKMVNYNLKENLKKENIGTEKDMI